MSQISTRFRISRTMFGSAPITSIFMSPAAAVWLKRTIPAERHRVVRVADGYRIFPSTETYGPVLRPTTLDRDAPWRLLQSTGDSRAEMEWDGSRCFNVTKSGAVTYNKDTHDVHVAFDFDNAEPYRQLTRRPRGSAKPPVEPLTTIPPDTDVTMPPEIVPRPAEPVHHDASVTALMGHVEAINRIKADMDGELDLRVVDGYVEAWILTRIGGKR